MENQNKQQLQRLQEEPWTSLTISEDVKALAKLIVAVNSLVQFPLESIAVIQWAKDIERLAPAEDLAKLPFLMDAFKTNQIVWDKTIGIQNIFINFKFVRMNEETGRYKILQPC